VGDMKGIEVKAHTIKGMLANVSFRAGRRPPPRALNAWDGSVLRGGLPEELARLEQEASLALAEIEAFCTEGDLMKILIAMTMQSRGV